MKLYLSKKHKLIVAVGVLLLVLLIVYAQFLSVTPLKSDLGIKKQELKSEEKLLDIVSQKKAAAANTTVDTKELQKKLPVGPLQEQFILDLEKAENVSNSQITSMGFSKDAEVAVASDPAAADTNAAQATTTNTTQTTTADPNAAQAAQPTTPVPAGMKKMTVQLNVESPKYENLEKFIETLESLPRLVVVEAITYSGGQEITSLAQEDAPISYSLTISAFYMPTLSDLAAEQPTIDAPAPAGKDNPLSQFPSTATTQP